MLEWFYEMMGWEQTVPYLNTAKYSVPDIASTPISEDEIDKYIKNVVNEIREEKFKKEYKIMKNRLENLNTIIEVEQEDNPDTDDEPDNALAISCL